MNKKKWILVAVIMVVFMGVAYFVFVGQGASQNGNSTTAKLEGLQLKIDNSFFEIDQFTKQLWLIVETTVQNNGEDVEYFLFGQTSRFYVQSADGKTYATINAHEGRWSDAKGKIALSDLKLYPKENKALTLQLFNVPKDATGLKLFFRISAIENGKQVSIPFTPSQSSAPVSSQTPIPTAPKTTTSAPSPPQPTAAITAVKGSPSEAALKFLTFWLVSRNYSEAEKLMTPKCKSQVEADGGLENIFIRDFAPNGDTSIKFSVAILSENMSGDNATVKVRITGEYNGEKLTDSTEVKLQKVESAWLVDG